jgi:hypothetical protein
MDPIAHSWIPVYKEKKFSIKKQKKIMEIKEKEDGKEKAVPFPPNIRSLTKGTISTAGNIT